MSGILTHVVPAYCLHPGMAVVIRDETKTLVLSVKDVKRPWCDREGTPTENGKSPCLVYYEGFPQPWYYESGWDYVNIYSSRSSSADD